MCVNTNLMQSLIDSIAHSLIRSDCDPTDIALKIEGLLISCGKDKYFLWQVSEDLLRRSFDHEIDF